MKLVTKIVALGIVMAGFYAALAAPEQACAQTSSKGTGTWVHYYSGGAGKITMTFNANGTYQMVTHDPYGRVFTDAGRFTIVSGVMLAKSKDGSQSRLYFFWRSPDLVTIRIAPEGSDRNDRHVDGTFSRVR